MMTAEHGHRGEEYERGDAAAYQAAAYAHVDRDEDAVINEPCPRQSAPISPLERLRGFRTHNDHKILWPLEEKPATVKNMNIDFLLVLRKMIS